MRLGVDKKTHCVWTRGIDEIELPARHGEGKFVVESDEVLTQLERSGRVALRYIDPEGRTTERWSHNPNGSHRGVAGVTDASGRVLGLMPHPDAFLHPWHHPRALAEKREGREPQAEGLAIFRAGLDAALESL